MGLAFGLEPHALALEKNMVDTRELVTRVQSV
jgi:heterodisulfide reductase subunit B